MLVVVVVVVMCVCVCACVVKETCACNHLFHGCCCAVRLSCSLLLNALDQSDMIFFRLAENGVGEMDVVRKR